MNKQEKADSAFEIYSQILEAKSAETNRVIYLGHLFKDFRDNKRWKDLDTECGSFNEFLAMPEIGIERKIADSYIKFYEKYIEEHHFDVEYLSKIGYRKLRTILPLVDENPEEWVSRAKTWSIKDLINAVREKKNRPPMKKQEPEAPPPSRNYLDYVKSHGCLFHARKKAECAHFPRTDKRGAMEDEVIPLCHDCHMHLHDLGVDSFFGAYKNQICGFYYATIKESYKELARLKEEITHLKGIIEISGDKDV